MAAGEEEFDEPEWLLPAVRDFKSEFEILETIGKGNFGAVYAARHCDTDYVLAVKRVRVEVQSELAEIQREINIMQACDCPFVVHYYGHFIQRSDKGWTMYIFMEYMEIGSLRDVLNLRQEGFAEKEIAMICRYVLLGLLYLHYNKKIHRDIKADNVLVNAVGEAKLADFGVSGQMESTMAKKNTLIGTPVFIAPEVIANDEGYNTKVDIWSLGITSIELAETVPPYHNKNPMTVLMTIPKAPPPTLKDKAKWSPFFHAFVAACLTKDPTERPSADMLLHHPFILEFAEECEDIMGSLVDEIMDMRARGMKPQEDKLTKKRREVEEQMRRDVKPSKRDKARLEEEKKKSYSKWDTVQDTTDIKVKKERKSRSRRKDKSSRDKKRSGGGGSSAATNTATAASDGDATAAEDKEARRAERRARKERKRAERAHRDDGDGGDDGADHRQRGPRASAPTAEGTDDVVAGGGGGGGSSRAARGDNGDGSGDAEEARRKRHAEKERRREERRAAAAAASAAAAAADGKYDDDNTKGGNGSARNASTRDAKARDNSEQRHARHEGGSIDERRAAPRERADRRDRKHRRHAAE